MNLRLESARMSPNMPRKCSLRKRVPIRAPNCAPITPPNINTAASTRSTVCVMVDCSTTISAVTTRI